MAAGIGSRYGGLKQIDPVGPSGEIILDYSVYDAIRAGFGKVIFIIRPDIEEAFRAKVGANIDSRIETEYVYQQLDDLPGDYAPPADRTKPWGTGHALLSARRAITGPFCVINADDFYGPAGFSTIADFLKDIPATDPPTYAMVGYVLAKTLTAHGHLARGVCSVTEAGLLEEITERTMIRRHDDGEVKFSEDEGATWTPIDEGSIVSMNLWGFPVSFLEHLAEGFETFLAEHLNTPKSEYFIPSRVNELLSAGLAQTKVLPCPEQWLGVTYQQDKAEVVKAIGQRIANGEYPERLWS